MMAALLGRERPLIWITGAAGFLGARAAAMFAERGWRVVGIARSQCPLAGQSGNTFSHWFDGGIETGLLQDAILKHGAPEAVFHAAGGSTVRAAYENPLRDFGDNVISTAVLLDVLRRQAPQCVFVLASSAAIYGQCEPGPISEDKAPAPVSPYGRHKRMAEELCEQENRLSGMRTIVVRYFSIYGPELRKQIIWDIVRRIRAGETRIELFGTGEEIRDFIFVDDAVDLIRDAIAAATSLHTVVNGGTGMPTRIADLASLTRELLCPGVTIEFNGQERAGDPKFYQACSERAKLLGFRPRIDLRGGLGRYRSLLIHQEVPS